MATVAAVAMNGTAIEVMVMAKAVMVLTLEVAAARHCALPLLLLPRPLV